MPANIYPKKKPLVQIEQELLTLLDEINVQIHLGNMELRESHGRPTFRETEAHLSKLMEADHLITRSLRKLRSTMREAQISNVRSSELLNEA